MAFLLFEKQATNKGEFQFRNLNSTYQLAGWGLIYKLWESIGKPINKGYSFTANDILKAINEDFSQDKYSLVIDFHPSAKNRIGLIEIEKIHLYTDGEDGHAYWTPLMLEIQEVFHKYGYEDLSHEEKAKIISTFTVPKNRTNIVEFLYLQGDDQSWNWGKNGMTNAAFIYPEAREYFKQFF